MEGFTATSTGGAWSIPAIVFVSTAKDHWGLAEQLHRAYA
jgi:hypothetical protein